MGGGRTKRPKLPPEPPPVPTQEDIDTESARKAEDIRRKLKARTGRRGTILTEGDLGVADIRKHTLLGGGM